MKLLKKLDVVFISGPLYFIANLNQMISSTSKVVVIEGSQPHRKPVKCCEGLNWERLRHANCGGVLDLQFWFGWSGNNDMITMDTVPKRFLLNILSSSSRIYQRELTPLIDSYARYDNVVHVEADVISSPGLMSGSNLNIKVKYP